MFVQCDQTQNYCLQTVSRNAGRLATGAIGRPLASNAENFTMSGTLELGAEFKDTLQALCSFQYRLHAFYRHAQWGKYSEGYWPSATEIFSSLECAALDA